MDGDKAHIHATINYAIRPQLVNTTTLNPLRNWKRVVLKRSALLIALPCSQVSMKNKPLSPLIPCKVNSIVFCYGIGSHLMSSEGGGEEKDRRSTTRRGRKNQ